MPPKESKKEETSSPSKPRKKWAKIFHPFTHSPKKHRDDENSADLESRQIDTDPEIEEEPSILNVTPNADDFKGSDTLERDNTFDSPNVVRITGMTVNEAVKDCLERAYLPPKPSHSAITAPAISPLSLDPRVSSPSNKQPDDLITRIELSDSTRPTNLDDTASVRSTDSRHETNALNNDPQHLQKLEIDTPPDQANAQIPSRKISVSWKKWTGQKITSLKEAVFALSYALRTHIPGFALILDHLIKPTINLIFLLGSLGFISNITQLETASPEISSLTEHASIFFPPPLESLYAQRLNAPQAVAKTPITTQGLRLNSV